MTVNKTPSGAIAPVTIPWVFGTTRLSPNVATATLAAASTSYTLQSGTIYCLANEVVLISFSGNWQMADQTKIFHADIRLHVDGVLVKRPSLQKWPTEVAQQCRGVASFAMPHTLTAGVHTIEIVVRTQGDHTDLAGLIEEARCWVLQV